ncbi:MAG: hypothetical protein AB7W28_06625 [Armatimonadota bacterium]
MRKRGMARDPLSWIGEGSERQPAREEEAEERTKTAEAVGEGEEAWREPEAVRKLETNELPKFATLVPVTARLSESQVEFLDSMERRIMRNRRRRKERITKNTLIRAALELLRTLEWDWHDIADEEELIYRLRQAARVG